MPLELIVGRSGTGKSNAVDRAILRTHEEGTPSILIVPDPSTFEAENRLLRLLGGGLFDVEVLGLTRLAYRVMDVAGGQTRVFLNADGKKMALRKIMEEKRDELQLYGGQGVHSGFVDHLSDLIRNFKYAELDASALAALAEKESDILFQRKLHDLAVLYGGLEEFMADRFIDAEDAQNALVERIAKAAFFQKTAIFIDGIPARLFSTQTYHMIGQLLRHAKSLTMTVCLGKETDADASLFAQQRHLYRRLLETAKEAGAEIKQIELPKDGVPMRSAPACIRHLEKQIGAYENKPMEEAADIQWMEAPNPREEVEAAATYIENLLRDGAKCHEIVIAMGNPDVYRALIRRRLSHLPVFMDEGRSLLSHGVVELSLASIDAARKHFHVQDVLRVAKSGFSLLSFEEVEQFENYIIQYGIRFAQFCTPFVRYGTKKPDEYSEEERQENQAQLDALNAIREKLMEPLMQMEARLKQAKTAFDFCEALFLYFEDIRLRERLDKRCDAWAQMGEWDFANECAQVWNIMLELLDQIATMLEGEMNARRFAQVLEEGCVSHQIGMIPAQADQITAGDVTRLALRECQHLIVLGCNEGNIPTVNANDGLMDDTDLERMARAGYPIFFHSDDRAVHERHTIYSLLSRAEQSLYVSWSSSTFDGAAIFPSRIADRIKVLFPNAERAFQMTDLRHAYPQPRAFSRSIEALRTVMEGQEAPQGLDIVTAYWQEEPQWTQKLAAEVDHMTGKMGIQAKNTADLYTFSGRTSVSRLEMFNDCAFKHFVRYGFQPKIRREYREEAIDQGNYYHEAFDVMTREILREGGDWNALTKEGVEARLDDILDQMEINHNQSVLTSSARNQAMARRMRRIAKQGGWAMVQQIQAGEFRPVMSEISLGYGENALEPLVLTLQDGKTVELVGKIDRLDRYEDEQGTYIRIIDYKTGANEFTFQELYYGLKLQLPLYCRAVQTLGHPAGMFYLHISEKILKEEEADETWEAALLKKYQLKGIVLRDEKICQAMDGGESTAIVAASKNKDGSFRKNDKLIPLEQMQVMLDFAEEKSIESIGRILAGETTPAPIELKGRTSCDRCDYAAICRMEARREGRFRTLPNMEAAEFWQQAGHQAGALDETEG